MGCMTTRESFVGNKMSPEEKKMIENEKKLPLSSLSSKEIIRSLKSEVNDDSASFQQLKRALLELKLNPEFASKPEDPFYILLKTVKTPRKLYSLKELSVLAILLGKGQPQEKANWLFKQYDEDASGRLSAKEIREMLNDIITVACEKIPLSFTGDLPNQLSETQIKSYFDPILSSKDVIISEVLKNFPLIDIAQEEFVLKMCDPKQSCNLLLSSDGVRCLCKSLI